MNKAVQDPRLIISWNANGLVARCNKDLEELRGLVRDKDPCLICIQEARVKAYCSNPKAKTDSEDPRNRSRPQDKAQ